MDLMVENKDIKNKSNKLNSQIKLTHKHKMCLK